MCPVTVPHTDAGCVCGMHHPPVLHIECQLWYACWCPAVVLLPLILPSWGLKPVEFCSIPLRWEWGWGEVFSKCYSSFTLRSSPTVFNETTLLDKLILSTYFYLRWIYMHIIYVGWTRDLYGPWRVEGFQGKCKSSARVLKFCECLICVQVCMTTYVWVCESICEYVSECVCTPGDNL